MLVPQSVFCFLGEVQFKRLDLGSSVRDNLPTIKILSLMEGEFFYFASSRLSKFICCYHT